MRLIAERLKHYGPRHDDVDYEARRNKIQKDAIAMISRLQVLLEDLRNEALLG
jgi:hypothetical protein